MNTFAPPRRVKRRRAWQAGQRYGRSLARYVAQAGAAVVLNDSGVRLDWKKGGTMAVPTRSWAEHAAPGENAVLFSFTDEPVLRALGLFREEAGA